MNRAFIVEYLIAVRVFAFLLNIWLLCKDLHFYKELNDKPKKGSSCGGISGTSELGLEVSSIV